MDAVLIAGGRAHAPLTDVGNHSVKGLFSLQGTTLIARVLHALRQSGVERIAVVGSELLLHALPALDIEILFTVEGTEPVDNLLRGVERLGLPANAQFLHCAVDLPMLTGRALCEFWRTASPNADVLVGWTPETAFVQRFPGAPYTAVRFAEGRFLSASVSVMRVGFLESQVPLLRRLAAARKSSGRVLWTLMRAFHYHLLTAGMPLAARFLTGRLALRRLPPIAERLMGAQLQFYLDAAPELAFDIDTEEDYRYAQAWLQVHGRYTL